MSACKKGHIETVKYLNEHGADVNATNNLLALILASRKGHLEIVKYLFENDANLNAKDENERTLVMNASFFGHLAPCSFMYLLFMYLWNI